MTHGTKIDFSPPTLQARHLSGSVFLIYVSMHEKAMGWFPLGSGTDCQNNAITDTLQDIKFVCS